ncbi:MAG: ribokinase [Verrucomicrobia bacterium]|jgi:ribokinase|nr:ribokinase [Verrucomicrobiota bacterium]
MKPKILVIGSSNTDMIVKVPRIPCSGETVLGGEFVIAPGGKGANQAVGAARAGGDVTFIARVGDDMFGRQAIDGFHSDGICVDWLVRDPQNPSGVALIFVDASGKNSIAVAPGANARLSPADLHRATAAFRGARLLVMQLETPLKTVADAVELAAHHRVPVILNPAPVQPLPGALLQRISILTPNEVEATALTGVSVRDEASAAQAAAKLRARGVETVIITMDALGAFVDGPRVRQLVPSFKVKVVDSTGAGDVFCGALAVALGEGKPLLEAVRFANAAAALSVTRFGAQPSAPTRAEIEHFLTRSS